MMEMIEQQDVIVTVAGCAVMSSVTVADDETTQMNLFTVLEYGESIFLEATGVGMTTLIDGAEF